jgi:hypothetical protein
MKIARKYEIVPLSKIVPYSRNAKVHSKEQISQIRASFREFGVLAPCLVDESYNLLAGHGRLLAAQAEELSEINCVVVEGLSSAQKKAYILADNRISENATWDFEFLSLEFTELKDMGFDLELTGFDLNEIEKLFASQNGEAIDDNFDVEAALKEKPLTKLNDLWTLGKHRLLVGDATDSTHVTRLMDGGNIHMYLTDPPFGVSYKGKAGTIKNDDLRCDELYEKLLLPSFSLAFDYLYEGGWGFIFHASTQGEYFYRAYREAGFKLSGG